MCLKDVGTLLYSLDIGFRLPDIVQKKCLGWSLAKSQTLKIRNKEKKRNKIENGKKRKKKMSLKHT